MSAGDPGRRTLLTGPRYAVLLAVGLIIWFWPSVFGGKVFLPLDLLWQTPPIQPPAGVEGDIHNFLVGDLLYENYAWKTLLRESAARGEWPLWNPYSFCGHPLYTTGQASTFYPFNLIFLVAPLAQAYVIFIALQLWMGGVFQYAFLRKIGVEPFGAAVGGTVFAFCGFFAVRLIWPMLLGSAIWLPLMLMCIVKLSQCATVRQAVPHIAWGAVVFALPLLSGFFEIAFYAYITAGLFTLFCCGNLLWTRVPRALRRCRLLCVHALVVAVLGAMLAGPQLLPFLEVKDRTTRVGEADYERIIDRALQPRHLWPIVIPDFYGNPAEHQVWDLRSRQRVPIRARHNAPVYSFGDKNYSENGYYLGLLPLLMAVLALRVQGRHRLFMLVLLIFSLLMAFGMPPYAVFYHVVSGFEQVRTPFRWMYPATFAMASLAAIGAGFWHRRLTPAVVDPGRVKARRASRSVPPVEQDAAGSTREEAGDRPPRFIAGRIIAGLLLAGPIALLIWLGVLQMAPERAHALAQRAMDEVPQFTRGLFSFLDAWDLAGFMWSNFMRLGVVLLISVLLLVLPFIRRWSRWGAGMVAAACLLFVGLDPGQANRSFNTHADPAWLNLEAPSIRFLQDDIGPFRIGRFRCGPVLHPNLPVLYGLQDVGGYDSIILSDYSRYLGAIEDQRSLWYNQVVEFREPASLDSPLLSLLNIRYLMTREQGSIHHPDWELAFEGSIRIYRNLRERPRAFVVHRTRAVLDLDESLRLLSSGQVDPGHTALVEGTSGNVPTLTAETPDEPAVVRFDRYAFTSVGMSVETSAPGVLVLCDVMYPGWRAYVDGQAADILTVDGIFRGVQLPAGSHDVTFRFEPVPLRRGVLLAAGGGLAILVGLAVAAIARIRSPETTAMSPV
jgi:hypothetical protein